MIRVTVKTDVTTEPVILQEVKEFCGIDSDFDGDDSLLNAYNTAARKAMEGYLNISIGQQTRVLSTDKDCVELLYGPVNEIVSVKNKDGEAVEYDLYGKEVVDTGRVTGGITVEYTCGELPPEDLKIALKMWVRSLYDEKPELSDQARQMSYRYSKNLFI